jgi:hypothetical protein
MIGPPKISFPTLLFKIIAGFLGGSVGTLILLLVFVLFPGILDSAAANADAGEFVGIFFIFFLLALIFISSSAGNVLSALMLSYTENQKYKGRSSAIYRIFIMGVMIFVLMIPVYIIAALIGFEFVGYAVGLHLIISAQVSALILEITSDYKYALVGVYGITVAVLLSATILFGLNLVIKSPAILLFVALPVIWGAIGLVQSLTTMFYGWLTRLYEKDFLAIDANSGIIKESEQVEDADLLKTNN